MTADAGIPIARPTVSVPVKLDQQGRLDEDISCRKCGYNLHSLLLSAQCPECGTAVGRSLQGDFLRFADPQWVEMLASGMTWILIATAAGTLGILASLVAASISATGYQSTWFFVASCCIEVIGFIGYWKLSTSDPGKPEDGAKLTARKLVRITQPISLVRTVLARLFRQSPLVLSALVGAVGTAMGIVETVAAFTYVRRLALRIPDVKLARQCRIIMWGTVLSLGLMRISTVVPKLLGWAAPRVGGACVFFPILMFLLLWTLRLFLRLRKAFKEAARLSAATWAAAPIALP
jgi:hypothetical protein